MTSESKAEADEMRAFYETLYAAVPEEARRFAEDTWGETWAHAEMGSLMDFAALASTAGAGAGELVPYLHRQWAWSRETFGPALRTKGIIQHITKELGEIEREPHDLSEWVDVIILAMDGFWRHGGTPEDLMPRLQAKQDKNFARTWPDWRTMGEDQAIEHDRSGETLSQGGGAGRSEKGEGEEKRREAVLDYLFGPNGRGWVTVTDLAYTAFMRAKGKNDEDGGPTDWFTDTKPLIEKGIATMRARVEEMLTPAQSPSTSDAEG